MYYKSVFLRSSLKPPLWNRIKAGTLHSWEWFKTGSVLFQKNFSISRKLLRKKLNGEELSYKEHQVLVTTSSDIAKLVPFSFFVIVPFAELLLPVVVKFYPKLLPSTYDVGKLFNTGDKSEETSSTTNSTESSRSRRFRAKQELMEFFKEVSLKTDLDNAEISRIIARNNAMNDFKQILIKCAKRQPGNSSNVLPDAPSIKKLLQHFPNNETNIFRLDNLKIEILESICYMLNIDPFGFRSHILIQLKRYINDIRKEDKSIKWDGIHSLSMDELIEANRKRGLPIDTTVIDEEDLRNQLKEWIDLSSNRDIPISLLLWIRAFALSENLELLEILPQNDNDQEGVSVPSNNGAVVDSNGTSFSTYAKMRAMSEEMVKRLNALEQIEVELDQHDKTENTNSHIDEKIKLLQDQIDGLNKEVSRLTKIKRMKRVFPNNFRNTSK